VATKASSSGTVNEVKFESVPRYFQYPSCSAGFHRAQFLVRCCSCCTPLNYYNSLRAAVFVCIFILTIHRCRIMCGERIAVSQHVSITLLRGCIQTTSCASYFESRCRLRSASSLNLIVRWSRLYRYHDMLIVCFLSLVLVWNSLPPHVKSASSVNIFKTRLKTFLFSRSFP